MNMEFRRKLPIPMDIKNQYPLTKKTEEIKAERDKEIKDVFCSKSDKFILIIGPCSADNEDAVMEYMSRLAKIVYVADKTEQTRPYPTVHLLQGTLDEMFVKCLVEANSYCYAHHQDEVYPLTLQALGYYAPEVLLTEV